MSSESLQVGKICHNVFNNPIRDAGREVSFDSSDKTKSLIRNSDIKLQQQRFPLFPHGIGLFEPMAEQNSKFRRLDLSHISRQDSSHAPSSFSSILKGEESCDVTRQLLQSRAIGKRIWLP